MPTTRLLTTLWTSSLFLRISQPVRPNRRRHAIAACACLSAGIKCALRMGRKRDRRTPLPGPERATLLVQQNRGDDAGGDRREDVVATRLHPVVAARRGAQMVAAPVVHDILAAAVFGRQAAAAIERMIRAGAAPLRPDVVVLHCLSDRCAGVLVSVVTCVVAAVVV